MLSELEGSGEEARGESGVAAGTPPTKGEPSSLECALWKVVSSPAGLGAPREETGTGTKAPGERPLSPRPMLGLFTPAPRGNNTEGAKRSGPSCLLLLMGPPFPRLQPFLSVSKYHFLCGAMVTVDSSCCSVFVFNVLTWQISSWHPMTGTKVDF